MNSVSIRNIEIRTSGDHDAVSHENHTVLDAFARSGHDGEVGQSIPAQFRVSDRLRWGILPERREGDRSEHQADDRCQRQRRSFNTTFVWHDWNTSNKRKAPTMSWAA